MGVISLKRVVCDTIASYISTAIPALAGKTGTGGATPDVKEGCLGLRVMPETISFEAAEAQEVWTDPAIGGKVTVHDVGQFTGMISLQLFTASMAERELYEQQILDLFLNSTWSPGTLYLNTPNLVVNSFRTLYPADFKLFLEEQEWNEEFAFESKRYTFLTLYIDYPALAAAEYADTVISLCQTGMDNAVFTVDDTDDQVTVQDDGTTIKGSI